MNPEAFFWLIMAGLGTVALVGIVEGFVSDYRERRRVRKILGR